MNNKFKFGGGSYYPGNDYFYIYCDICGKKIRRKDSKIISDKWNRKHNLVVCREDFDLTNEQDIPIHIREKPLPDPKTNRSEPTAVWFSGSIDNRVPSAPQFLMATGAPLGETGAWLTWLGPIDPGSDQINGYIIYRTKPQYGAVDIIAANTGTPQTVYNDSAVDGSIPVSYQVAAINSAGIGTLSNVAYWPFQTQDIYTYILSEDGKIITTEDGNYLIL